MSSTDINNQFANAFANVDTEENLRNIVNALGLSTKYVR